MKQETGKVQMAKLARIEQQIAELDAESTEITARRSRLQVEKAKIYEELAGGAAFDLRTAKRITTRHVPRLPTVISADDRLRAQAAIRQSSNRRRAGT